MLSVYGALGVCITQILHRLHLRDILSRTRITNTNPHEYFGQPDLWHRMDETLAMCAHAHY